MPENRQLAQILESISDAFVALDRDWRYTYVNAKAAEIFGRTREALIGKHIWTEFPEGVGQPFHQAYERAMAEQVPIQIEEHYQPYDRWFENRIYPTPDGLSIYFTDITARKRAESALRQERDLSDAIINSLPGVFYFYDSDLRFLRWNTNFERVTGRTADEIARMQPLDFFADDDRPLVAARIADVFARGESSVEAPLLSKDGGQRQYFFTGRRMDFAGQPCLVGVGIDVQERHHIEETLRDTEHLLSESQRIAHIGAWSRDLATGLVQWSAETYRILGVPAGTPVKEDEFLELVHSDDRAPVTSWIVACLTGKHPAPTEFRVQPRDGGERLLEAEIDIAARGRRDRAQLIGTVRDVTDQRATERRLFESEERLRLAIEAGGLGTFDWDVPGNRIVWSKVHEELWGFAPGQFAGTYEAFAERVHPDDLPALDVEVERCIASRATFNREFRVRRPDGSIRWVNGHGEFTFDAEGRPLRMHGVVADVTTQHDTAQALRDSEQRFRTLVDEAADPIVFADAAGNYREVNPAACALWGYTRDEFLTLNVADLVAPSDLHKVPTAIVGVQAGRAQRTDWPFARKDGTTFIGEVNATRAPNGWLVGICRDVTARYEADRRLQEQLEALSALSNRIESVRDEEATRIARELHDELGQALTGLRLDASWIDRRLARDNPEVAAIRQRLVAMTEQVDATIQTVRRISTDLRPGVLEDLGLSAAVEWQAEVFARRTGMECVAKVPDEELSMDTGAAAALYRILLEALTNVVRHAKASRVDILLRADDRDICLEVRDNGQGMDPDAAESGSLGLLGMRERARAHGGTVTFDGAPGRGTTVSARLPVSP